MEVTGKFEEADQYHQKERLKMRVAVLEENVRSSQVECRAGQVTLIRLMEELEQERRRAASSAAAVDSVKVELDGMVLGKRRAEMEIQSLTERLEANRRLIEAAGRESQCLEKQLEELDCKFHKSQAGAQAAQRHLQQLLEKAAAALQRGCGDIVPPTEGDILRKLDELHAREGNVKRMMETKLSDLSEEVSRQKELHDGALHRAQQAERQAQDLRDRLQGLENRQLAADVQCDGLRLSNQQYEQFLDQLCETVKVDSVALDLDFDMRLKLILSRAEQLVRHEGTSLVENKTLIYSLQRKVKLQRERLDSKELHTELLKKKVSEMEEETKRSRSSLAVDRDDAHLAARRLQKKVERLQSELSAVKVSSAELKAQLSHSSELKLKVTEQSRTLQRQSKRLAELEEGKAEAERSLSDRSCDLRGQEEKSREDRQQLTELRLTLDQLSQKERELVDFKMVVSQMLGMDAAGPAVPNYEIIKSLENLVYAPHHHQHHQHHQHLLHHPHHLHHHLPPPWRCAAHPEAPLPPGRGLLDGSPLDASTLTSTEDHASVSAP